MSKHAKTPSPRSEYKAPVADEEMGPEPPATIEEINTLLGAHEDRATKEFGYEPPGIIRNPENRLRRLKKGGFIAPGDADVLREMIKSRGK